MDSVALSSSSDPPTKKPFLFFGLPSELRIKIYQYVLFIEHGKGVVDLERDNDRRIAPRLTCFRASQRMHDEAYPIFYGSPQQPFRLFPIGGNVYKTKKPLLELLTPNYRAVINTIELRLGPGWERVSLRSLVPCARAHLLLGVEMVLCALCNSYNFTHHTLELVCQCKMLITICPRSLNAGIPALH